MIKAICHVFSKNDIELVIYGKDRKTLKFSSLSAAQNYCDVNKIAMYYGAKII